MQNIPLTFDFDDILIIPSIQTSLSSRYKDIELPIMFPLFTAPMDTVVGLNNVDTFISNGIEVTLPRTIPFDDVIKEFDKKPYLNEHVFFSLGFEELDKHRKNKYKQFPNNGKLLIDVANGHMKKIIEYTNEIKNLRSDITIMVGNIANPDTYYEYASTKSIKYIRVGVGNGNGCLTTKQSGIGYPMASLIYETKKVKNNFESYYKINGPAIVADGGMKTYSDVVKALALGADYVMIGSIFNKAIESCAPNYCYGIKIPGNLGEFLFKHNFPIKKCFRGMSTKEAQKAMGKTMFKTSEGIVRYRNVEYTLEGWVENFEHYLRNAMSYTDSSELQYFIGNVKFCQITEKAYDRFNK